MNLDILRSGPVLVTGATGFAGGHLLEAIGPSGDVVGWGRSAPRPELSALARWESIDLLDRDRVRLAIARLRPHAVFHLAGAPQVAESWRDTTTPLEHNVLATAHLLDAVRRAGLECRILVTGSAAVYAPSDAPLRETDPVAPASPYALSKLAQERLALHAFADEALKVIVVRPFNHTGPRQSPLFVAPSMARQIALIERGRSEPVIQVGNLESRRDFTDVRDVVRAYVAIMERGQPGSIYNVGSGTARTIRSLLDALRSRSAVDLRVETDPVRVRPSDTSSVVADAARVRTEIGWQPEIPFDVTLDDLLAYWRTEAQEPPREPIT